MKVKLTLIGVLLGCLPLALHGQGSATQLEAIPLATKAGSAEPNLFVSDDNQVFLSWLEPAADSSFALKWTRLEAQGWLPAREVAKGRNWFVNWADFPSMAAYTGQNGRYLAAHWLAKSAPGTFDYDVAIAQSLDGGTTWSDTFRLNRDGIPAEHGFVSLLPMPDNRMFAAWLDGRHTKMEGMDHGGDHDGHGGGPMSLRGAFFNPQGQILNDWQLDGRVCDCCQTGAALTANGPIVVYRDRSEKEIRDISYVRWVKGQWSKPTPIARDNWLINGCPVNGPAIAAQGKLVAVAWFSGAKEQQAVKLAFSSNAGASFGKPIRIDSGQAVGRVDLVLLDDKRAAVSWIEERGQETMFCIRVVYSNGTLGPIRTVLPTSASRKSGFPRLAKVNDKLLLAWTELGADNVTQVKTAWVKL